MIELNRMRRGPKDKKKQKEVQSPKIGQLSKSKRKLAQSAKKINRQPEEKKVDTKAAPKDGNKPIKNLRASLEDSSVNKSYDANNQPQLPTIDPKKKSVGTKRIVVGDKSANKKSLEDLAKENEELRLQNKQLQATIAQLKSKGSGSEKAKKYEKEEQVVFKYERQISNLELKNQAMQIKQQENDKLITQLLQTIDFLNQNIAKPTNKPGEQNKAQDEAQGDKSGHFLFNKSELVQSHTQIKQMKYTIFEGFKSLQGEINKKCNESGKIIGIIDYLLLSLDGLFNIIHQLEIKELQYLNLLAHNEQSNPQTKSHK